MTDSHRSAGRVVIGVDGSASSQKALEWALAYAEELGLEVTAVHAWQYPYVYGPETTFAAATQMATDAQRLLDGVVEKAGSEHPAVRVRPRVVEGHPARVLVRQSEGAHMLILGSRGHGALVGALIGSVGRHCVVHARCPVLIVPG
ncbi:universal stress protein [Glycomyces paridis]|uniref:Universal stress protein n=1 Tax=Glycomyces paridis TaxID=2126555 RepID=A0A4S8PF33_9ACTN|nr:universal stress protein [Glycomyces paridis]THV29010.1 universal stress protein [Glycomyces paridis]